MNCPECQEPLLKLPVLLEEKKQEIYIHPESPFKKCIYENDGTKITVEVVDEYMVKKFQERLAQIVVKKKRWFDWVIRQK